MITSRRQAAGPDFDYRNKIDSGGTPPGDFLRTEVFCQRACPPACDCCSSCNQNTADNNSGNMRLDFFFCFVTAPEQDTAHDDDNKNDYCPCDRRDDIDNILN